MTWTVESLTGSRIWFQNAELWHVENYLVGIKVFGLEMMYFGKCAWINKYKVLVFWFGSDRDGCWHISHLVRVIWNRGLTISFKIYTLAMT